MFAILPSLLFASLEGVVCGSAQAAARAGDCGIVADAGRSAAASAEEIRRYRDIAYRIFAGVAALGDRYPALAAVGAAMQKDDANDKLWVAYHYTRGMI
jgi:hypothetical protein